MPRRFESFTYFPQCCGYTIGTVIMSHLDRKQMAAEAAEIAQDLAFKLTEISLLDRWHAKRLLDLESKSIKLLKNLTNFLDMTNAEEPVMILPTPKLEAGVAIKVADLVKKTRRGALLFEMPGFVGGTFEGSFTNRLLRRADNRRYIPANKIVKAYDPETGVVVVDKNWYLEPAQEDLRVYAASAAV